MPRKPEPPWPVIKKTLELAVLHGKGNLTAIRRSLDIELEKIREEEGIATGDTPDERTIRWIVNDYINELPREAVREQLPPSVWTLRKDYEEFKSEPQEELSEPYGKITRQVHRYIDLLHQWREQAQFLSLDQLLRVFGREAQQIESLRHTTDRQRVLEIYDAARGQHVQDIPELESVLPELTEESLWQRLRQQYREDPVWEVQDAWGLAHGAYLEAFRLFFAEAQRRFECYFAGACMKMLEQRGLKPSEDTVLDMLDNLRKEDVDLAIILRLTGVIVSCDLLALGIAQLPDSRLWLEVDKLETVRAEAVNYITELPEPCPVALDHIGTAAKLLWEHEPEIRQKTGDLLDKLQSLHAADDDLHSKLSALERKLYGIDESQPL